MEPICSLCKLVLDTAPPQPTMQLLCNCRAHTRCFIVELSATLMEDAPSRCFECQQAFVDDATDALIDTRITTLIAEQQQTMTNINPCFILDESSPEFLADVDKLKALSKQVRIARLGFSPLLKEKATKFRQETNGLVTMLKNTRKDAIRTVLDTLAYKSYKTQHRRLQAQLWKMIRRYEASHRELRAYFRQRYRTVLQDWFGPSTWQVKRQFRICIQ